MWLTDTLLTLCFLIKSRAGSVANSNSCLWHVVLVVGQIQLNGGHGFSQYFKCLSLLAFFLFAFFLFFGLSDSFT